MLIKLTEAELRDCIDLAQQRHDAKHASFRNRDTAEFANEAKASLASHEKISVPTEYMAHFIGLLGEAAYAKHTGQEVDRAIYAVRDGGEDFPSLEVKTITYRGKGEPELKIPVGEFAARDTVETYVLARANTDDPQKVELLGKIDREQFEQIAKIKKYGRYKPTNMVVGASQMEQFG